jgi:hypothetical protein
LTVNRCTIAGNSATSYGGGIENAAGTLTVNQSTLTGNFGTYGGGIDWNGGTVTVSQSTVVSNSATTQGGGIWANSANVVISNSIVAGNSSSSSPNVRSPFTSSGVNLTNGAPIVAPLGNYGGPTPTMPPLPGSPAIDGCTNGTTFATDQRGQPRISGPFADIGAVEGISVAPPIISGVTQSGTNLIFTVTNGLPGGTWNLLTATNVAAPLPAWFTNNSGVFDLFGNVILTNPVNVQEPQRYYRLGTP